MDKIHNEQLFYGTINNISIKECAISVISKCAKSYFGNTSGSVCAHTLKKYVLTHTHIFLTVTQSGVK